MDVMRHPPEFADTDPKALAVWLELQRRMTPSQKVAAVFELTQTLLELQKAGVRQMYPEADDREVFLRAAARRLSRETMIAVYGWDPEAHGHRGGSV